LQFTPNHTQRALFGLAPSVVHDFVVADVVGVAIVVTGST